MYRIIGLVFAAAGLGFVLFGNRAEKNKTKKPVIENDKPPLPKKLEEPKLSKKEVEEKTPQEPDPEKTEV